MNRKKGIVAFVDILGYSSLMENSDIGENTEKILNLINSLPKTQKELELKSFNTTGKGVTNRIESIEILIISDSILFTMPYTEEDKNDSYSIDWAIALMYLSSLYKTFMDNGLPLRGAVSCGEFMTVENCFAGKPIILAYKEGQKLNCAGIVLDENALKGILKCVHNIKSQNNLFAVNPLKHTNKLGEVEEDYFVTLFLHHSIEERVRLSNERELTIYLTSAFTAHNKKLNEEGKQKLNNTIDLFSQSFNYNE